MDLDKATAPSATAEPITTHGMEVFAASLDRSEQCLQDAETATINN